MYYYIIMQGMTQSQQLPEPDQFQELQVCLPVT